MLLHDPLIFSNGGLCFLNFALTLFLERAFLCLVYVLILGGFAVQFDVIFGIKLV